jgi:hypothetical protein
MFDLGILYADHRIIRLCGGWTLILDPDREGHEIVKITASRDALRQVPGVIVRTEFVRTCTSDNCAHVNHDLGHYEEYASAPIGECRRVEEDYWRSLPSLR